MDENYPLKCTICGKFHLPTEKKMYSVVISQIMYEPYEVDGDKYPHKNKEIRDIQMCEDCLRESVPEEILFRNKVS